MRLEREEAVEELVKVRVLTMDMAARLWRDGDVALMRAIIDKWRKRGWVRTRRMPKIPGVRTDRRQAVILPGPKTGVRALRSDELRYPLRAAAAYVEMVTAGVPRERIEPARGEPEGAWYREGSTAYPLAWVVRGDATVAVWTPRRPDEVRKALGRIVERGPVRDMHHVFWLPSASHVRSIAKEVAMENGLLVEPMVSLPPPDALGETVRWLMQSGDTRLEWCRQIAGRISLREWDDGEWHPRNLRRIVSDRPTWLMDGMAWDLDALAFLHRAAYYNYNPEVRGRPTRAIIVTKTMKDAQAWARRINWHLLRPTVIFVSADAPPGQWGELVVGRGGRNAVQWRSR